MVDKEMLFSSNSGLELDAIINTSRSSTPRSCSSLSSEHLSVISGIAKRKLPVPIFSDEEYTEDDEDRSQKLPKKLSTDNEEKKHLVNLNKPSCSTSSPRKKRIGESFETSENPKKIAQSCSSTKEDSNNNAIAGVSKTVKILQNVLVPSTKKSPQKHNVKSEGKKVNYEQLRVFREFYLNVLKHDHLLKVLSANDRDLLNKFFNMERDPQYICVKLFMWKPIWYNIFKFTEKLRLPLSEEAVSSIYQILKNNGFVDTTYENEDLSTLLDLLSLADVRAIGRSFKIPTVGAKHSLISKLMKLCRTQFTLTSIANVQGVLRTRIEEKMGLAVKLSERLERCLFSLFLLNTFSNFTLVDPQEYFKATSFLNIVFPAYNVETFYVFYTPREFYRFVNSVRLRNELQLAIEKKLVHNILEICKHAYDVLKKLNAELGNSFDNSRPPHLERYTANAQYIYILSSSAKHLPHTSHDDVRIWLEYLIQEQEYCKHKRGEWINQLALIYSTYDKDYEKAAKLLIKALKEEKDNFSDVQLEDLANRIKILNRKTHNLSALYHDGLVVLSPALCDRDWPQDEIEARNMENEASGRKRVYAHRAENGDVLYLTVEQTALAYYKSVGFPNGEHCEGSLIRAAFVLLFWDIIYETYVKGTFISKVQDAPLDLCTKYFYINREKVIKKRLNGIKKDWSDEKFKNRLMEHWNQHSHEHSVCQIDSVVSSGEELYNIVMCVGRPVLSGIFERLVHNFRLYRSGLPDLIVWNLEQKQAKFVEVKSENDKLSTKQKLWLNYLIDIGANVAVCHVRPKSSKKLFKKLTTSAKK